MPAPSLRETRRSFALGLLILLTAGCGYTNVERPRPDGGGTVDSGLPIPVGGGCFDNDGDGVPGSGDCAAEALVDCDDQNPTLYPGADELCDDADNDCDEVADEDVALLQHYLDGDVDGYGAGTAIASCHAKVEGRVTKGGDCDDANAARNPGATELCNTVDDDCDGTADDGLPVQDFYTDADQDGFGAGAPTQSCQATLAGKVINGGDCNDANANVKPGTNETCNNVDDNCDGQTDEIFPTKGNTCSTGQSGVCASGTRQCVSGAEQCLPITPATSELCDGLDNDCDGSADETFPDKNTPCSAGLGVCATSGSHVCSANQQSTTCTATAGQPNAPACDGQDNDCDGQTDEAELTAWWDSAVGTGTNPTAISVAPFYFTASGCNGGQSGTGTDGWDGYYAGYVVGGDLHVQRLWEDGDNRSAPLDVSSFSSNQEVAMVQAGSGMVAVARWGSGDLDLYYVGSGPAARTITGASYKTAYSAPSGSTISNVRAVRGFGGRFVVLWTETTTATPPVSKIRMARFHFTAGSSATDFTLVTDTAAKDLITTTTGSFGAAASIEEYGDTLGCQPVANLARFGVAHTVDGATKYVRFETFNEDGTAVGTVKTVYSTTSTAISVGEPAVAWAYVSGDRWGVVHSLASTAGPYERVNFWQSLQTINSGAFGANHSGNGTSSVIEPRITSRTSEFLIAATVHGTATDAQVWAGKKGHDGTTLSGLAQLTWSSGCSLPNCSSGTRKLARPLSSAAGTYKTPGAVLFGGSSGDVRAGNIGCN